MCVTEIDATRALLVEADRFLTERQGEVIALTSALVAAPTPNPPGDELAAAAVIERALSHYGLPTPRVVAEEPHRPNLLVRIDGARPGPHLALCGHLDTKPVGDAAPEWRTDPFTPVIEGDRLFALGSTDMKGACAAMVLAGAAFARIAERAAGSLSLVFTADEDPHGPRRALAVEPMTAQADAFRSREDLVLLSPGHTFSSSWGIRALP